MHYPPLSLRVGEADCLPPSQARAGNTNIWQTHVWVTFRPFLFGSVRLHCSLLSPAIARQAPEFFWSGCPASCSCLRSFAAWHCMTGTHGVQIVLANQKGLNPEEPEVGSAALSESLYSLAVSLWFEEMSLFAHECCLCQMASLVMATRGEDMPEAHATRLGALNRASRSSWRPR